MKIRAYLFMMAAGILVPVVVFSGIALGMLQDAERAAALRNLSETANSIGLLVDRELYSAEAALTVLAASPSLARDDMAAFYREALTARRGSTGWALLLDAHGRQVMNTLVPYGAPLPPQPVAAARVARVLAAGRTHVSDVITGPVARRLITTVNVPLTLPDGRRAVLAEGFATEHFIELISQVKAPEGWRVGILDRQGRYVARNVNAETRVGRPADPRLVAAARASSRGMLRHATQEGVDSYDVYTHSQLSGWTITVAAPVASIERSARRASMVAALGLLAATLAAIGLAALFGSSHVNSIRRAVQAARDLGKGVPPSRDGSRVSEVAELHAALHAAGAQLLQAQVYRKEAESQREQLLVSEQQARLAAEQQNRAKDQFLAMLGHELRNPLAPISTAAQLLRLQSHDPGRVRYASDVITRQVDHMNSLLGDMLDVSRVTRGLVTLSIEQVSLASVIERAVEQTHAQIELKHHQLRLNLPPDPVLLRGDATRLIQIFANLLGNAAKYTPPRGRIQVDVVPEDEQVKVIVSDNGEGISGDLLPRVFELFSQGERQPDRSQGGLGLGLALVRSLVQLHGGSVGASSPGPDLGSSFVVALPCLRHGGAAAPGRAPGCAPAEPARAERRVMIVDDNIDGAISLSLFLKDAGGHHTSTYYDAGAALEWALFERPEVFILDIGLPDITGYELARRLRAMAPFADALFIALTGYGQPDDRERARQAGFEVIGGSPDDLAKRVGREIAFNHDIITKAGIEPR
jgi:signal transduction histidine kinase/CheY-like chemotaxis protein